jgi:hypothetical protein
MSRRALRFTSCNSDNVFRVAGIVIFVALASVGTGLAVRLTIMQSAPLFEAASPVATFMLPYDAEGGLSAISTETWPRRGATLSAMVRAQDRGCPLLEMPGDVFGQCLFLNSPR